LLGFQAENPITLEDYVISDVPLVSAILRSNLKSSASKKRLAIISPVALYTFQIKILEARDLAPNEEGEQDTLYLF